MTFLLLHSDEEAERLLLKVSERKRSYEALQLDLRKAVRQVNLDSPAALTVTSCAFAAPKAYWLEIALVLIVSPIYHLPFHQHAECASDINCM